MTLKRISYLASIVLLCTLSACKTHKNNFLSRGYHGTTTHYNYYFNARERMRQGAQALADAHEDKYDRVLSVFKYGDVAKAKSIYPDMDEAIKKASVAIQRHSIYAKSRHDNKLAERNKWIEDCYLVIGQAQFYKHDFWTAIETFQYTSAEYKNGHIRDDALLWLIKSYLELGKTVDAEYLLDFLKNDKEFPLRIKGDYAATYANYYLQKNQIPEAMEQLKTAAANTRKKDTRARYYFILGQLQQRQDSLQQAFASYSKVIRLNPPYEMAFNARINRARCFDVTSEKGELVKKELLKMLKDEKNKEYLDQVYYALAGIAQQEKKEDQALDYLNKSVRVSSGNTTQKAISYKSMGDIYYQRPEYIPAAAYYDSAVTSLTIDYPDYYDILERKNSLDRLVKNLKIILMEDSIQNLSKMSAAEREASIDKVINLETAEQERLKKEKEDQQRIEEQQVLEEKQLKTQPRNYQQNQTGAWYFYNPTTLNFGINEFLKKWGLRKLEDNWRRSDKELVAEAGSEEGETSIDSLVESQAALNDSLSKLGAKERKEAYLKLIPSTSAQLKESNAKLTEAYYNVAIIYKEQLANYPQSVYHFEKLDERFPQNKYKQPSYYNLYRLYLAMHDTAKADVYKNYLLTNYPESEYSKLILNPNFFAEIKKKTAVLQVFYENTYRAYINGQYSDVIERKTLADTLFPKNNILAGKFALLKALAIGRTQPISSFEVALEDVVRVYPKDSVSIRAQQILDYIHNQNKQAQQNPGDSTVQKQQLNQVIDSAVFTYAPESPQLFLILVKINSTDLPALKGKITSFNNMNYVGEKMDLQSGNLDLNYQYITVTGLKNKEDAMSYYDSISSDETISAELETGEPMFFVISQENLTQLARTHDIEKYSEFFQQKYTQ